MKRPGSRPGRVTTTGTAIKYVSSLLVRLPLTRILGYDHLASVYPGCTTTHRGGFLYQLKRQSKTRPQANLASEWGAPVQLTINFPVEL